MEYLKQIYQAVGASLEAAKTAGKIERYYYDWNFDQLREKRKPPVAFPAILFDLEQGQDFTELGSGRQQGQIQVTFEVIFKVHERATNLTAAVYEEQALGHLEQLQVIYEAIGGTTGECFTALYLADKQRLKRVDYRIYKLDFYCTAYIQRSGQRETIAKPPPVFEIK